MERVTSVEATGRPPEQRYPICATAVGSVHEVMAVDVSTPVYEGPFDLLLHLILKDQVDIYEINLSTIVDAYLAEIENLHELDLDVATGFLLIAATLVELKARRMLPDEGDVDLDEELALWEERDLLLARLLEAKTFKDVARVFADLHSAAGQVVPAGGWARRTLRRGHPRPAGGDERAQPAHRSDPRAHPHARSDRRSVPHHPDQHHRRRRRGGTDRRAADEWAASASVP